MAETPHRVTFSVLPSVKTFEGLAGGMVEFRRSLAASFLFRFFVHVATKLEADVPEYQSIFPDSYKSAAVPFHRPPVQGLQYFSKAPGEDVVGQPMRHMAADLQVTMASMVMGMRLYITALVASSSTNACTVP